MIESNKVLEPNDTIEFSVLIVQYSRRFIDVTNTIQCAIRCSQVYTLYSVYSYTHSTLTLNQDLYDLVFTHASDPPLSTCRFFGEMFESLLLFENHNNFIIILLRHLTWYYNIESCVRKTTEQNNGPTQTTRY